MIEKDDFKTVVIFRKYKDDSIIALFPMIAHHSYTIDSYMRIGQHGAADYHEVLKNTILATEPEYAGLKEELESIGYNLVVKKKAFKFFWQCEKEGDN